VADEETSANIPIATKSLRFMFSPAVFDLRERYVSPEELSNRIFMWSALTCQRFGKRRLVAALIQKWPRQVAAWESGDNSPHSTK
jgi:hypothetical protein